LHTHTFCKQGHKVIFSYPPQPEGGAQASEDSKTSLPAATSVDEDDDEVEQDTEFVESPMASASRKRGRSSEELGDGSEGEEHNSPPAKKRVEEILSEATSSSPAAGIAARRVQPLRSLAPPEPRRPRVISPAWNTLVDIDSEE
jgi:hypothetical protein